MKGRRIIVMAAVALLLPGLCRARESSPFKYSEKEWNFGKIREDGGVVTHAFSFVNEGENPIAIDRVSVSCGCTTPRFPREPIAPGGSAEVRVSFDPRGFPGDFSKSVIVVSGGGKYHDMLTISGHVIPRVKTVEEEYPFEIGGGLRVDNTFLAFRQVAQGKASSMTVKYANTSGKAITVEAVQTEPSGLLNIRTHKVVCAGCKGEMTFTYDLTDKSGHYGMIHDVTQIAVDGKAAERTIYTSMVGVDDFSRQSIETSPRVMMPTQYHNYGLVQKRRAPYAQRMKLSNEGEETLHIRSVTSKPGIKTTLRAGMSVAPGATLPFELLFYSNEFETGEIAESVIIVTNDPIRPVREIRISANIK